MSDNTIKTADTWLFVLLTFYKKYYIDASFKERPQILFADACILKWLIAAGLEKKISLYIIMLNFDPLLRPQCTLRAMI